MESEFVPFGAFRRGDFEGSNNKRHRGPEKRGTPSPTKQYSGETKLIVESWPASSPVSLASLRRCGFPTAKRELAQEKCSTDPVTRIQEVFRSGVCRMINSSIPLRSRYDRLRIFASIISWIGIR